MFGLLDRKRPDADAVRRVKALVADRFDLPETTTLAVAELRCYEPGSRLSRPSLPREASRASCVASSYHEGGPRAWPIRDWVAGSPMGSSMARTSTQPMVSTGFQP